MTGASDRAMIVVGLSTRTSSTTHDCELAFAKVAVLRPRALAGSARSMLVPAGLLVTALLAFTATEALWNL